MTGTSSDCGRKKAKVDGSLDGSSTSSHKFVTTAEIKVATLLVENNIPLAFADKLSPMFKEIFPDSNIAKNYHSARMKTTCILNGAIAPHVKQTSLVEQLKSGVSSMSTDGSNDKDLDKMNPITVKLFDINASIYSCGEEKLHPAENSRLKQMRQSISELENEIRQLNKEFENRQAAVDKVNSSKTNRIETELLEADDDYTYMQNGVRNWRLLRKHVYAIEHYCKENMNGKIPPKHELNVLDLALNDENPELDCKISQHQTHRQNPCKNVLENNGIVFPESSDNGKAYDSNASNSTVRYMPLTREEEQLKIALAASARSCSTGIHTESYFDPQGKQNPFLIS
ncbi:Hypothetical predicted protein [Paramuricea clavata]|uniref:Uncharacterized protein n=1 Tax=Paramuricea clavata TaxID=317549 RepID=A0A6S7HNI7_PARCT|nr:Hypothetical predicted protein [Paramuricea clavata]